MISLTRINDRDVLVNSEQIELIEEAPDTTITTITGKKVIVRETPEEIMEKIVAFKRRINKA
ncbi:MAG: flagellar FlbD family protein [Defluviitaleaceae bacterium]|nr:flagellar FlbD family protein [Defluviitaleaceae bacterium]MCL2275299.1 flagellar FlbD family protein [Defluviitaleaceae bacterium]